jgi:hypothetical protein
LSFSQIDGFRTLFVLATIVTDRRATGQGHRTGVAQV